MRFLLVTGMYRDAALQIRGSSEREKPLRYEDLYKRYSDASFGVSDRYAIHLADAGWDAKAVFGNDKTIQQLWAREHGVEVPNRDWNIKILCEQIRRYQTEVLFLLDLYRFDRVARDQIRGECPGLKFIAGWRSAPCRDEEDFSDLDLFLSSLESLVRSIREKGIPAEHLSAGFDTSVLGSIPSQARPVPFSFCGSISGEEGHHSNRNRILRKAFAETPLQIWSGSNPDSILPKRNLISKWRSKRRIHDGVFGREMYRLLGSSQVALNVHIDAAGGEAVNMRLFEATGMGACLLTDNPDSVGRYFELDREVVGYSSPEEMVEKVDFLLANPTMAKAVAERGQAKTLSQHSLEKRSGELADILSRHV